MNAIVALLTDDPFLGLTAAPVASMRGVDDAASREASDIAVNVTIEEDKIVIHHRSRWLDEPGHTSDASSTTGPSSTSPWLETNVRLVIEEKPRYGPGSPLYGIDDSRDVSLGIEFAQASGTGIPYGFQDRLYKFFVKIVKTLASLFGMAFDTTGVVA